MVSPEQLVDLFVDPAALTDVCGRIDAEFPEAWLAVFTAIGQARLAARGRMVDPSLPFMSPPSTSQFELVWQFARDVTATRECLTRLGRERFLRKLVETTARDVS